MITRPDYWTGLLFKRLMGNGVLATKLVQLSEESQWQKDDWRTSNHAIDSALLSYCHCSRRFDKGLALLLVNPANANTSATMRFTASGGVQWDAVIYQLSAGFNSTDILLNGDLLQVTKTDTTDGSDGWSMPSLDGKNVTVSPGSAHTVIVERQSYLFVEYPNAKVSGCAHVQ